MCVKPTFKSMSSSAALLICMSPNVLGASSRVPISRLSSLLKVAPCCTKMMRAFTPLPASSGMKGGPGVCSKDKTHTQKKEKEKKRKDYAFWRHFHEAKHYTGLPRSHTQSPVSEVKEGPKCLPQKWQSHRNLLSGT